MDSRALGLSLAGSTLFCTVLSGCPSSSSDTPQAGASSSGASSSSGTSASGSSGSDASSTSSSGSSGGDASSSSSSSSGDSGSPTFRVSSSAFAAGARVPDAHTCASGAAHVSPPLAWENPPAGTQSFAVIVRDPNSVGGATDNFHWAIYNVGAGVRALPQGVPAGASITSPLVARQTTSSFGGSTAGYFYACPPQDTGVHSYTFVIHALSVATLSGSPTDRSQIEGAVAPVSLGSATLVGTYSR